MSTEAAIEFDQLCQDYMNAVYQGVSGFISYQPGEKEAGQEKKIFLTYGEILYPSVNKIMDCMNINENDVFYDLGSGIGKVTLQYFLKSPVKKAVGIEASETRHNTALEVYDIVRKEFPDLFAGGREINSICGNFLIQDISDATIIYTCSTCFDEELLQHIGELVDRCPNLKYLATNKKITNKLPLTSVVDVDCTWDKTKWHIYGIVKEGMAFLPEEEPLLLDVTDEGKAEDKSE